MNLLSRGGVGTIYKVNAFVAVKRARVGEEVDHANEQAIFSTLKLYSACPHLIQSFYRVPKDTFLEFLPNGDLTSLLRQQQTIHPTTYQVLAVKKTPPLELTCRWMRHISAGATWLEAIGLAHCDIRPANVLLDAQNNAKLADFDRSIKVGDDLDSGTAPFARLLGKEDGLGRGTYGKAGPRTETFAIGSVFYSLTRGHDPYETEWFGKYHGRVLIDMLQGMQLPQTTDSVIDTIIQRCWNEQFVSVKDLSEEIKLLDVGSQEVIRVEDAEWLEARKKECEEVVRSGALEPLDRM